MLIKRGSSPTEELLTLWGHQNHTVVELFILLSNMQHYQAMSEIKHLVDEKYHVLITEGERNIDELIRKLKAIPEENFNRNHVVKIDRKAVLNDANKVQVRVEAVSSDNNPPASSEQLLQNPQQEQLKPKSPLPLVC